jgi:hypothetical protein
MSLMSADVTISKAYEMDGILISLTKLKTTNKQLQGFRAKLAILCLA